MSSLFSYELDEAQIRLTLQNSKAVEYSESEWDDFEANYNEACSSQTTTGFKLPEFNLNINRNIVLPVIFIAGLVGVSAIMLSFVDFKTNTAPQVEKQLIPDPDNFKPEETKTAVMAKPEPVKKEAQKPVIKKDSVAIHPPVKNETPPVTNANPVVINTNTQAAANTASFANTNTQARMVKTDTNSISGPGTGTGNSNIIPVNQNYTGQKKKRRRKLPADQIETIKAPSLLGEGETTSKEPELELKLN